MSDPTDRLSSALQDRYRIERELGQGGMATVYLAEDLKHKRKVAIKVLKPELAAVVGAERFLAEIETTAALQHPHILPLFDSGEADGFLFYVMPYIEGESLRERLERERQLPVDEALAIARDVADALDYAHRQGVVHRDIKPANILLHEGRPQLADFGIALAVSQAGGGRITETGLSMGTPHYMSPEQAAGERSLDPRSDVYALGCVLYEMLTGQPPFGGPNAQAVLGRILTGEPDPPTRHRKAVPPHVEAAVLKSLERLPADRFDAAAGFAAALGDPTFRRERGPLGRARKGGAVWKAAAAMASVLATLSLSLAAWALWIRPPQDRVPLNVAVSIPDEERFSGYGSFDLAPDGSFFLYQGPSEEGGTQLWLRRWSELHAEPIPGTQGAALPAISPDGSQVVFQGSGSPFRAIRTVSLTGGPVRTLADTAWCCATWADDETVYFTDLQGSLSRVSSGGGPVEQVLPSPRASTWAPDVFAEGRRAVQSGSSPEGAYVYGINLETGDTTFLAWGADPAVTATGHLLFVTSSRELMAAPFDSDALELTGTPVPVATDLLETGDGIGHFAVSRNADLLLYRRRPFRGGGSVAGWIDGDRVEIIDPEWVIDYAWQSGGVDLSPSGDRLAVTTWEKNNWDIWVKQLPDGPAIRLTLSDSLDARPTWTPDGRSVTFISARRGAHQIYRRRADGSAAAELLHEDPRGVAEIAWSPDGAWLVYRTRESGPGAGDIMGIRPGVDTVPRTLVATPFRERHPAISADGRWIAYASDQSGRFEVFVRPFPDTEERRIPVSSRGGSSPLWSDEEDELYYVAGDQYATRGVIRARVDFEAPFEHEESVITSSEEFSVQPVNEVRMYDVDSASGRVLAFLSPGSGLATQLVVVQNFAGRLPPVSRGGAP